MIQRILVWDLPTRIFHWSLVLSFAGAFLTAESEHWRTVHVVLGYTVLGLLAFRLVWGFAGSRHARFAEFVRGPQTVLRYLKGMIAGRPTHYTGHNPLGAVAILLLIGLGIASGVSGWLLYEKIGGEAMEEVHEALSNGMLAVVVLHIVGVIYASLVHRENLVLAMVTGRKRGEPGDGIAKPRAWIALLLVAALAGFWTWSGFGIGKSPASAAGYSSVEREAADDGDDD